MKIIIFGANDTGADITAQYYANNDITIIDKEKNKNDNFNKFDISFVDGMASDIDVLKQADVENSDVFIACTDSDELNIIGCLTAKRLKNDIPTLCFIKNEAYQTSLTYAKNAEYNCNFYIDFLILPKQLLTQEIFRIITVSGALDVENFANGKARLLEYKIEENSILVNSMIKNCEFPKEVLIVGINREDKLFIPDGETVLQQDDKVFFMGLSSSLDILAGKFFHKRGFVKNVVIIGGGSIGLRLAKSLEESKVNVKIIEKNLERCEYLSENLSNSLVINADGTDIELLNEEDISSADVVVSVTNNDEKNLLCSLMAKQLGVNKVISRVSKSTNAGLFEKVGVDITISSKVAAMNEIKNSLPNNKCDILATVEQGKGEVLEIILPEDYKPKKLMDLKFPRKAIVSIIQRRNRIIIPNGATQLMGTDKLIIFTTSENAQFIKEYFMVA